MSSRTRIERGDANRLDLRTLVIASVASAVAAIVVSRVWASGTPIAAAATPVLVTLLKEALDRPAGKIAERFTADTRALPGKTVRREAGTAEMRVYRQRPSARATAKINPKVALITGLLAFVIAGLVITGGQVLAGNPFGSDGNGAIILGQQENNGKSSADGNQPKTTPDQQQGQPAPQDEQQPTADQQPATTTPSSEPKPPTPSAPQATPNDGTSATPATPPASP